VNLLPVGDLREPQVLKRLAINGLPPDKMDELRRRLPVQEGQVVDNEALKRIQQAIASFEPKLTASIVFMKGPAGDGLALVIFPIAEPSALAKVPQKLTGVVIQGLSPEAEAELRRRVSVREGAVFTREEMAEEMRRLGEIVKEFDPHLRIGSAARARRTTGPDGLLIPPDVMEVTIRIYPEGALEQFAQFSAAPPSPAPTPGVMRIRVGGAIQASKLTKSAEPIYPDLAKQARISGVVRLNIIINPEGKIFHMSVIGGHPLLVPAALEAVKQYEYSPTLLNGVPVEVVTQVDVNFTLSQ
jgi:TonB family protein